MQLAEKYRPKTFDDLIGNKEIIAELKLMTEQKSLPHLLLTGPPGTGKTSAIGVMRQTLYGNNRFASKEINASTDNGIDVIRTDVKDFATHASPQGNVPFKLLILEESDELTSKAQPALRRIMELYSKHCRFILTGNKDKSIIDAVKDRTHWLQFIKITPEDIFPRLKMIFEKEHVLITDKAIKYISEKSDGSMRNALNKFGETIRSKSNKRPNIEITLSMVQQIKLNLKRGNDILKKALNHNLLEARELIFNEQKTGLTTKLILNQICEVAYTWDVVKELMKADIAELNLEMELALLQGAEEVSVITAFIGTISKIGKKWRKKNGKD